MRRPASLSQFPTYPIAGGLGLMAVLVTLMSMAGKSHGSIDALTMNALAFWDEPWRLVTSALPHGDAFHLLFNVYWMWSFGTVVEETFGHVATFLLVIVLQVGSGAAEYAFLHGGIGLSGVGFGLLGFLWVLSRRDPRFAGALDASTLRLFAIWFVFCCIVTVLDVWHVANIAHGMGFVVGVVLGDVVSRSRPVPRLLGALLVAALVGGAVLGASYYRPYLNLSSAGADFAYLGYQASVEGRNADAIRYYRRALELDAKDAGTWFNLGISLAKENPDESVTSFREAHRLDVVDPEFRKGLRNATFNRAQQLQQTDCAKAVPLYRESLAVGGESAQTLYGLAICLGQLGEREDALRNKQRAFALDPKVDKR
jgi:membrane associated rhomboid family serine protease/Tfp pilus assembly protein PilF